MLSQKERQIVTNMDLLARLSYLFRYFGVTNGNI